MILLHYEKTNKILIITFLLFTLCAMIIMPFTKIDKIILSIGHFALALIKYLLHIIPFSDSVYEAPTQDTTALMLQPELAVAQATPEWLTFLFDMLFFRKMGIKKNFCPYLLIFVNHKSKRGEKSTTFG